MKKLLTTAAVLAMLATAAQAAGDKPAKTATPPAKGVTGQTWIDRCNSRENVWQSYCWAYTRAVADTAILWADMNKDDPAFCIAHTMTSDQLVAVGRKYLKANPEMLEWNAATFLAHAFHDSFTCGKLPGQGV
jgi:hypothetical protein